MKGADMDDKTYELIRDEFAGADLSDCCGALIVLGDICSDCKEHCSPMEDENM